MIDVSLACKVPDTCTERVEIIPPSVELRFVAEAMGIHVGGTSAKTGVQDLPNRIHLRSGCGTESVQHTETCFRVGQRMERAGGGHSDRLEKGARQNPSRDCHRHDEEERCSRPTRRCVVQNVAEKHNQGKTEQRGFDEHLFAQRSSPRTTKPRENEILKIEKDEVKWSGSITFLGAVLEFGGHDAKALQYRNGQATTKIAISDLLEMASSGQEDDCLQDCDRILADWVGGNVALDESSSVQVEVLCSTHSGSGEGNPTSTRKRHGSLLEISSSRRTQTVGKIQCRLGARAPLAGAQTASTHCKVASSTIPKIAIKTKPLAWWAFRKEKWTDKHSGLHPKRFECWRWETQFENWCGIAKLVSEKSSLCKVGWMGKAANRNSWKEDERSFANSTQP